MNKKPEKPYKEFPLFAHRNGQWARKISGKLHYFGKWEDPEAALKKHNYEYPYLKGRMQVPSDFSGWSVKELCNEFLGTQLDRVATGEIVQVTFDTLKYCADILLANIDGDRLVETLTPTDFQVLRSSILKKQSPSAAKAVIVKIRMIFKFAYDNRLIDKPVFYGSSFKLPSKGVVRRHRNTRPEKMFSPEQIQAMIPVCTSPMKAMLYLGLNGAFNCSDVCNLELRHIGRDRIKFPRVKTGIMRVIPLWPETIEAIDEYRKVRHVAGGQIGKLLFVSCRGNQWTKHTVAQEFRKVKKALNERDGKQLKSPVIQHGSFGYFRHIFETIGGDSKDQVAVDAIMGHVDSTMAAEYRERIDYDRLVAATNYVRDWVNRKSDASTS